MSGAELHRDVYQRETEKAARRWAERLGNDIVNEAKDRCPVDEGTLRASITHVTRIGGTTCKVIVGSPLKYAEYFHTGTGIYGPHKTPIVPVSAQALKFQWEPTTVSLTRNNKKGRTGLRNKKELAKDKRNTYFFGSVKGMPADPFLSEALEAVMGNIARRRNL